ncbi:MAG: hypothetical protein ACI9Y1_002424 [Lentisphaeria bacterium]|jgi:hypothetical protein
MINLLLTVSASIVLLISLLSMLTPMPGGILLIALSLSVLMCTSPRARSSMGYTRARYRRFNTLIFWLEEKMGIRFVTLAEALKKTRPDAASESCDSSQDGIEPESEVKPPLE